VQRDKACR